MRKRKNRYLTGDIENYGSFVKKYTTGYMTDKPTVAEKQPTVQPINWDGIKELMRINSFFSGTNERWTRNNKYDKEWRGSPHKGIDITEPFFRNDFNKSGTSSFFFNYLDNIKNQSGGNKKTKKPDFIQRLQQDSIKVIPDWANRNNVTSHKLAWSTDDKENATVYPMVQNIDGQLIDFSMPPYSDNAAYDNAMTNDDYLQMSPTAADLYTRRYKDLIPAFREKKLKMQKGPDEYMKRKLAAMQELDYNTTQTDIKKNQKGSIINDSRGQWAHPGKVTRINSNKITMKGVPYPVIGISDTGEIQMMMPGEDYRFNGNSVVEYPMMQTGAQTDFIKSKMNSDIPFAIKPNQKKKRKTISESFADNNTLERFTPEEYIISEEKTDNGKYSSKNEFVDKSYSSWLNILMSKGIPAAKASRLAEYLTMQDALESGYGTSYAAGNNNYGGMMYKGKILKYDTPEEYYNAKLNMLDSKWPSWRDAETIEDYYNSIVSGDYKYTTDGPSYLDTLKNMKYAQDRIRSKKLEGNFMPLPTANSALMQTQYDLGKGETAAQLFGNIAGPALSLAAGIGSMAYEKSKAGKQEKQEKQSDKPFMLNENNDSKYRWNPTNESQADEFSLKEPVYQMNFQTLQRGGNVTEGLLENGELIENQDGGISEVINAPYHETMRNDNPNDGINILFTGNTTKDMMMNGNLSQSLKMRRKRQNKYIKEDMKNVQGAMIYPSTMGYRNDGTLGLIEPHIGNYFPLAIKANRNNLN